MIKTNIPRKLINAQVCSGGLVELMTCDCLFEDKSLHIITVMDVATLVSMFNCVYFNDLCQFVMCLIDTYVLVCINRVDPKYFCPMKQ